MALIKAWWVSRPHLWVGALLLPLVAIYLPSCGGDETSRADSRQAQRAMAQYQAYLEEGSEKLAHWAGTIVKKAKEGALEKAASRYAAARVPYGQIGPVAELHGRLNSRIDSTELEEPPIGLGFSEIERLIFKDMDAAELEPVAEQQVEEVEKLQRLIAAEELRPEEVAEGATLQLARILARQITGKEEPYALVEMTDIAAGIEGLEAAFAAIKPELVARDPELAGEIAAELEQAYLAASMWGTFAKEPEQSRPQEPGIAFVVYDEISDAERRKVAKPIESLATLFGQAQEVLEDA